MKKKTVSEMTSAGAVAAMPMSMNSDAPIKRESAPAKPKKKKSWRNSLHETAVSEAELSEQDLILTPGVGRKLKPGLMRNQAPHEALEMAKGDLLQCAKNVRRIMHALDSAGEPNIEPWVQEKLVKASDYLNTVCEYLEGQVEFQDDDVSVLTFEQADMQTKKAYYELLNRAMHYIKSGIRSDSTSVKRQLIRDFAAIVKNENDAKTVLDMVEKKPDITSHDLYIALNPQSRVNTQDMMEGKKRSDRYHIVDKNGNPADLASYADRASAEQVRDKKYPDAVVQQVGPRGKVKGVTEGKTGPGLWANIHAKRERIKKGSGERMRKPGSTGAPTDAAIKAAQGVKEDEKLEEIAPAIAAVGAGLARAAGSALGRAAVSGAIQKGAEKLKDKLSGDDEEKTVVESVQQRATRILSALKAAQKTGTGYSLIAESQSFDLEHQDVELLLRNYRSALQTLPESTAIKMFGHADNIREMLGESKPDKRIKKWEKELNALEHAKYPKLHDSLQQIIADHPQLLRPLTAAFKAAEKHQGEYKEYPDDILKIIADYPKLKEKISTAFADITGFKPDPKKYKSEVKETRLSLESWEADLDSKVDEALNGIISAKSVAEARKVNPYAVGMAAAKKAAGIKTTGKPVPKSVVTKGHEIGKSIEKDVTEARKLKSPYAAGMASAMELTHDKPPLKKSTIKKAHDIAKAIERKQK